MEQSAGTRRSKWPNASVFFFLQSPRAQKCLTAHHAQSSSTQSRLRLTGWAAAYVQERKTKFNACITQEQQEKAEKERGNTLPTIYFIPPNCCLYFSFIKEQLARKVIEVNRSAQERRKQQPALNYRPYIKSVSKCQHWCHLWELRCRDKLNGFSHYLLASPQKRLSLPSMRQRLIDSQSSSSLELKAAQRNTNSWKKQHCCNTRPFPRVPYQKKINAFFPFFLFKDVLNSQTLLHVR